MIAVSSVWGEYKTFRLIPIHKDCPYLEGIFDPNLQVMVFISDKHKNSYHMLPVLDSDGEVIPSKKKRSNGKTYKEERRMVETYQEYYIVEREEILKMLEMFCQNYDTFDFAKFMSADLIPAVDVPKDFNIAELRTGDTA